MASPPLTNREYAYFRVSGSGSHEIISKQLGWKPSEAWSEGDIGRNGKIYQGMCWRLDSGLDDKQTLQQHLESLFLTLRLKESIVRELSLDYDVSIQCVGYSAVSGHGVFLSRDLIRQAATLGCSIDFAYYCLDFHGNDG